MADEPPEEPDDQSGDEGIENAPDEPLTGKLAYQLHEEQGIPQRTIGEQYGVSQSTVSRRISTYKEGRSDGAESVSASDFDRDDLQTALTSSETDDPYTCGTCGEEVSYLQPRCNNCSGTLNWGGL